MDKFSISIGPENVLTMTKTKILVEVNTEKYFHFLLVYTLYTNHVVVGFVVCCFQKTGCVNFSSLPRDLV